MTDSKLQKNIKEALKLLEAHQIIITDVNHGENYNKNTLITYKITDWHDELGFVELKNHEYKCILKLASNYEEQFGMLYTYLFVKSHCFGDYKVWSKTMSNSAESIGVKKRDTVKKYADMLVDANLIITEQRGYAVKGDEIKSLPTMWAMSSHFDYSDDIKDAFDVRYKATVTHYHNEGYHVTDSNKEVQELRATKKRITGSLYANKQNENKELVEYDEGQLKKLATVSRYERDGVNTSYSDDKYLSAKFKWVKSNKFDSDYKPLYNVIHVDTDEIVYQGDYHESQVKMAIDIGRIYCLRNGLYPELFDKAS